MSRTSWTFARDGSHAGAKEPSYPGGLKNLSCRTDMGNETLPLCLETLLLPRTYRLL